MLKSSNFDNDCKCFLDGIRNSNEVVIDEIIKDYYPVIEKKVNSKNENRSKECGKMTESRIGLATQEVLSNCLREYFVMLNACSDYTVCSAKECEETNDVLIENELIKYGTINNICKLFYPRIFV